MSHTPGPWTHYDDNESCVHRHEVAAIGKTVARIYCTNGDEIEDKANARLIAAAPDLLSALRDMVAIVNEFGIASGVCCCGDDMARHESPMGCGHSGVDSGEYNDGLLVAAARAAILKATGGQS